LAETNSKTTFWKKVGPKSTFWEKVGPKSYLIASKKTKKIMSKLGCD
jgi:hypothetical protein